MKKDQAEETRPLPWLTPTLVPEGHTLTWTPVGSVRTLRPNKSLSFCPGAIIDGEPQPFVLGSRAKHTHLCQNLLLSIANPRVYQSALHLGSDSHKECCLHTFPKSVLKQ
jgi:hypothetical protein